MQIDTIIEVLDDKQECSLSSPKGERKNAKSSSHLDRLLLIAAARIWNLLRAFHYQGKMHVPSGINLSMWKIQMLILYAAIDIADWQWIERDERKVHPSSFLNVLTHIGLGTYNLRQKDE